MRKKTKANISSKKKEERREAGECEDSLLVSIA